VKQRPSRKKKSVTSQLRPFWVPILVLVGIAAVAGYYGATWPGFYPKRVTVSGNRLVTESKILAEAAISRHENLWLQNMHAAAARIETIPYVLRARVHRTPPANVRIVVSERTPFANVDLAGEMVLVDRELRVLETRGRTGLPVFLLPDGIVTRPGTFLRDGRARQFRDDYEALSAGHVIVTRLQFDRFDDLVATLRGGKRVLFGDDGDLAKKIPLVEPILAQLSRSARPVAAIDLRAPGTPVVVYRR